MAANGYDFDVPLLAGSHVTTDQGTGFVHIAPGHGVEDYELAHLEYGIAVPETVGEDGYVCRIFHCTAVCMHCAIMPKLPI